jgi:O-antigen/teichoic acid export membrane protein
VLCIVLIPRLGIDGAAAATATALVLESVLLFVTARRRLRHHTIVMEQARPSPATVA